MLIAVFLLIATRVQAILSTRDNPLLPPTTQITRKLSALPRPRCSPRRVPLATYTNPPCCDSRHTDSKAPHTHDFPCCPRALKGCFSSNVPGIEKSAKQVKRHISAGGRDGLGGHRPRPWGKPDGFLWATRSITPVPGLSLLCRLGRETTVS